VQDLEGWEFMGVSALLCIGDLVHAS
jgi:hypothetical protein